MWCKKNLTNYMQLNLWKWEITAYFLNSCILNIYLPKCTKFQLHIPMVLCSYKVATGEKSIYTTSTGKINYKCLQKLLNVLSYGAKNSLLCLPWTGNSIIGYVFLLFILLHCIWRWNLQKNWSRTITFDITDKHPYLVYPLAHCNELL